MADRVLLRSGTALAPPGFLRPGELAYSPQDFRLWIADGTGTAQPAYTGAGGGSGLTSFQGRVTAAAVLTSGDVTGALGYTPSAFDGAYSSLTGRPALFDGTYASLTGKPALATVATTGAYADLTGKPTLFDGTYASLTGKPTLGGAAALNVGTSTGTVAAGDDSRITGALSAATAASTYAPLASPTIDTATLTNTTNFGTNGAAGVALQVNAPATVNRRIAWLTAGSPRWRVGVVGASESGSNAGSDYSFTSYNDAGTLLGVPMTIYRATGTVDMTAAGSVLVPTATAGDNTTKAASTAFVTTAISGLGGGGVSLAVAGTDPVPVIDGTAAVGTSAKAAREDHVHPTDTTRAPTVSASFTGTFLYSGNAASPPAIPTTTWSNANSLLRVIGQDNIGGGALFDGFGAACTLEFRQSSGTGAAPTATGATSPLGLLAFTGYDGSSYNLAPAASISGRSEAVWSGTNHSAGLRFTTTPINSTSSAERMRLWASGNLTVQPAGGTLTDDGVNALQVTGSVNATGAVKSNGTALLNSANNLSDVASAATARSNLGVSAFAWDVGFDQGAVVANGTITVVRKAPFACTITSLDYEVGSAGGTFTVAVQIAGVSVTGLSAVAVSSSASANAAASGANTVAAGQAVTLVISSVTGSPTGANLQINGTR